jgi:uncharacterized membrane protein
MNDPKFLWAAVGLVVGIIGVTLGPLEAFIVLVFTVIGWVVGKYAAGEMPVVDRILERFFSDRLRGP